MSDVPHDDIHPNPENVDPTQLGDLDDPAVPAPIAPCGCTNVTKCRAHGYPKPLTGTGGLQAAIESDRVHVPGPLGTVASEAQKLWAATPPLAAFEEFIGQQLLRNARQDEASLRAMGATGPGDLLFEFDMHGGLSSGGVDRLRVLLTGVPQVAVELAAQDGLTKWSEVTAGIGKAMADCAKSIRELVEAWQRSFDPETGETIPPPRRTALVTCAHCQRDLFDQEADGSQVVEKYATGWSWQAGEPICQPGDHDGCQP